MEQGNHLPASPEEMMEMVQQSQLATGGADIMNYTFLRYMTHTVPTATDSQIKELINAGGITKVGWLLHAGCCMLLLLCCNK
jgi:hypothetical protein